MLVVAVTMGVLLALTAGTATQHSGKPLDLISGMLQKLEESVKADEVPNPSVLLAMNLAGDTSSNAREQLLQPIKEEAAEKAQRDMTSGKVALSVLALLSSGQDPRHIHAHTQGRTVDLVRVLQQKTDEEVAKLDTITVNYTVSNVLQKPRFCYNILVPVPRGSKLLQVMKVAKEKKPKEFNFTTEQTSWGSMVVSINGVAANAKDRTYWQLFNGTVPLQKGVDDYHPQNGDNIEAVFSTYRTAERPPAPRGQPWGQ